MNDDLEHLRLLAVFHKVVALLLALFGCFPLIHLTVGLGLLAGGLSNDRHDLIPAAFMGWLFVCIGAFVMTALWTLAIFVYRSAAFLEAHRRYTYCLVIGALLCTFMPFGTVLGIFTILVLVRPSVKALFDGGPPAPPATS
jgi:hypothetical protein